VNPGAWVTGGDGICRMRWVYDAVCLGTGTTVPKVEECCAPATQPVVYRGEPHLVCVDCEGPLLDKPGAEELGV
jgi:hypothetical protein